MDIFKNSKIKKAISIFLASLSITGLGGCKKVEENEINEIPDEEMNTKAENNFEERYDKALEDVGVKVDIKEEREAKNVGVVEQKKPNSINVEEKQDEKIEEEISTEKKKEEKVEENVGEKVSTEEKKENDLKKEITGMTEKERLKKILDEKDWGKEEEALIMELYDTVDNCYDLRGLYNSKDKQLYMRNLVNTVNDINEIKIDPNDSVLMEKNWSARADYSNNTIVLKFNNIADLRHEISHIESGTFLKGSVGVDLGFVFEEGRASFKEGDAMANTQWLDNITQNVDPRGELIIYNSSGSYPAFEEIYKNFIRLGIDMEKIRKEEQMVDSYVKQIENNLNKMYGNDLGTEYIESVKSYIEFFNIHGLVDLSQNQYGQDVLEVKQTMEAVYEKCMIQSKDKQQNKEVGMER